MPDHFAIEAIDLALGYRGAWPPIEVLSHVDLHIAYGEFLTILGPSGCGKSTLLRVVADLLAPLGGSIIVMGGTPEAARLRREVAFVFQDATLLPWRTVRENVALPLQVGLGKADRPPDASVDELLTLVGLAPQADSYPHQISGGQRQRVAIARALICRPRILLMDEPFGALDEITRDRLNDELASIWQQTGVTVLFVTHSIMEAAYLGQRVLVLAANPGQIEEMVDLRPLKRPDGRIARESPALVEVMAHLRQVLAAGT